MMWCIMPCDSKGHHVEKNCPRSLVGDLMDARCCRRCSLIEDAAYTGQEE